MTVSVADHPAHDSAVLLLDERLIVFAVRPAARENDTGRVTVRLERLVHENGVIGRVQAKKREGQLLTQFRQHGAQQRLLAHDQRRTFRSAGHDVSEDQGLYETAARRWTAVRDKVRLHEARCGIIPIRRSPYRNTAS